MTLALIRRALELRTITVLAGSPERNVPTVQIGAGSCLDHFGADPATRTILPAIDHVIDASRFLSSARAAARLKPVPALKPTRLESPRQAMTHWALRDQRCRA